MNSEKNYLSFSNVVKVFQDGVRSFVVSVPCGVAFQNEFTENLISTIFDKERTRMPKVVVLVESQSSATILQAQMQEKFPGIPIYLQKKLALPELGITIFSLEALWKLYQDISSIRYCDLVICENIDLFSEWNQAIFESIITSTRLRHGLPKSFFTGTCGNLKTVANWIHGAYHAIDASSYRKRYKISVLPMRNRWKNYFQFESFLNRTLYERLKKNGFKKTLCYCTSRKQVLSAANTLFLLDSDQKNFLRIPRNGKETYHDQDLERLISGGVGILHGGLDFHDRKQVTKLFLNNALSIICLTHGMHESLLPEHIIIKGGKQYRQGDGYCRYQSKDIWTLITHQATIPTVEILCSPEERIQIESAITESPEIHSKIGNLLPNVILKECAGSSISSQELCTNWLNNSLYAEFNDEKAVSELSTRVWNSLLDSSCIEKVAGLFEVTKLGKLIASTDISLDTVFLITEEIPKDFSNNTSLFERIIQIAGDSAEIKSRFQFHRGDKKILSDLNQSHIKRKVRKRIQAVWYF